jgi:hypothetical protein
MSSKKNQQTFFECDKCKRKLLQSNLKSHENNCNILNISSYIENNKFFGSKDVIKNQLPDDLELPRNLQNFVFVGLDVAAFCNFTMGSYAVFHINNKKYLKKIWTHSNISGDAIVVPGPG